MPIIRNLNPFRKQDENARPTTNGSTGDPRSPTGSPTKPIDIDEKEEPTEYKLSEINDSGVFIPPSPPERRSFWTTSSSRSTTSSNHRSLVNENEPFNISRESFDSYRRSFDISARSPIIQPEQRPRISLDSHTFMPPPRMSNSFNRPVQAPLRTQQEEEPEGLEDVSLDDPKPQAPQKKRGVFSRIMDSSSSDPHSHSERPASQDGSGKSSWHHFGGRKRGQSGQGSELGAIPKREATPKPDGQSKKENRPTAPPAAATPTTVTPETTMEDGIHPKPGVEASQMPEAKMDS